MEAQEKRIKIRRIVVPETTSMSVAQKYFSILSAISNVSLTEREIQLLAFTAIKGNMSYSSNREEFCTTYKSSSPTINNIISRLKKLGLLIKEGGKIKVHPQHILQFDKDITLQISLKYGE